MDWVSGVMRTPFFSQCSWAGGAPAGGRHRIAACPYSSTLVDSGGEMNCFRRSKTNDTLLIFKSKLADTHVIEDGIPYF